MRLFLDTNVLLDGYFQRPGAAASDAMIRRCSGAHSAWIAWHTLSNAFYLVRGHSQSSQTAFQFVADLLAWVEVAQVGKSDAVWAMGSGLNDFEDALQLASARACGAEVLITRNTADFKQVHLAVMTPEDFLQAVP